MKGGQADSGGPEAKRRLTRGTPILSALGILLVLGTCGLGTLHWGIRSHSTTGEGGAQPSATDGSFRSGSKSSGQMDGDGVAASALDNRRWAELREDDARIAPFPPSPKDLRVAVCLVGAARDFDLTGPSIMARLLTAYPGTHLFINSPLDENSFKLHALAWAPRNVTVAAVRIFPNTWVDEGALPPFVLYDENSPQGTQGMLQYFRLVQGCIPLISAFEAARAFRFNWILRSRVDAFWALPPPPLEDLSPHAYTIPHGSNCMGLNDRLGVGTWLTSRPALSRLSLLPLMASSGLRKLNSEKAFQSQLMLTNTTVNRHHFWFCIVSRRVYPGDMMPVASLSSSAPLNGAKCRPCQPWLRGREAERKLLRYHTEAQLGPVSRGVDLCNSRRPWERYWEAVFDRQAGAELADQRRRIMEASLYNCVAHLQQLQLRTAVWDGPSPEDVCWRRLLGPSVPLGGKRATFDTLFSVLAHNSSRVVRTLVTPPLSRAATEAQWQASLHRRLAEARRSLEVQVLEAKDMASAASLVPAGTALPLVKLTVPRRRLFVILASWLESAPPSACQLMVEFAPTRNQGAPGERFSQGNATLALSSMKFQLNSCIKEPLAKTERCTYYSSKHCSKLFKTSSKHP